MASSRRFSMNVLVVAEVALGDSEVHVTLAQVIDVPRILGVAFDLGQQQIAVARVLLRIPVAVAEATRLDVIVAFQALTLERLVTLDVFVNDTLVADPQPVAEQQRAPEDAVGGSLAQLVNVQAQPAEIDCAHNPVVGVDDPDVVTAALGEVERLGPVVAEIAPGPFVQLTGDAAAAHVIADQVLGPVVGARVHDHPRVDVGRDRVERLGDDVRLVLHDHVQADRGACGWPGGHGQIVPNKSRLAMVFWSGRNRCGRAALKCRATIPTPSVRRRQPPGGPGGRGRSGWPHRTRGCCREWRPGSPRTGCRRRT
jgi:hypothetical protein